MDKRQAQQLIKDTFENAFDKGQFSKFIRNLLNRLEDSPLNYQGNYIPEAYRQYIRRLERIGKYTDGEHALDVLIITLQKDTSLERARTMQRNFIAWYLNGSRPGAGQKDAALVAYVSPDQEDWRFSLVKMDYNFETSASGRVKVKEEFTPARRWSFLVGVNEKSHTAQARLIKILANDEHDPNLAELEEAFNIETVTKEFFLNYRELFLRTKVAMDSIIDNDSRVKADFDSNNVDTVDFAKKLLGQIVFLYFLQKKGWFGVGRDDDWGSGSKSFLREIFEKRHGDYDNFFNDTLEPLFYEALRIDRSYDDHYYSRFNCKIPFLNGGLFDPIGNYSWVHTDINLPNDLFSNTRKTKAGDIGDGILDVFERYNFTVREDEPLEKEVAIDPELLGKAYEKFNAIRPDNFDEYKRVLNSGSTGEENKFNKKFGVYYTPREIVHYMCQQSLINYLLTRAEEHSPNLPITRENLEDLIEVGELITEHEATALIKQQRIIDGVQKSSDYTSLLDESIRANAKTIDDWLADITVCDPAVGSGAFPVGMMSEVIRARNVLSVFLKDNERNDYDFKLRCIEHSLYGVDIDPGAVEIAKLRLWLSLVVDEDNIKKIKPLPNLDYKIMQGNSLIELLPSDLTTSNDPNRTILVKNLSNAKDELFHVTNPGQKELKRNEITGLIRGLFEYDRHKQIRQLNDKIIAIKSQLRLFEDDKQKRLDNAKIDEIISKIIKIESIEMPGPTEHFEWHVNFSDIFQYRGGFDVVIANPPYLGEKGNKDLFREIRKWQLQGFYQRKMDIFYFFFHLALNIGHENSSIAFITTNYYPNATGAKTLRNDFRQRSTILKLVDFNQVRLFESAQGQHNMITLLTKKQNNEGIAETCITSRKGSIDTKELIRILLWNDEETQYYKIKQEDLYEGTDNQIRIRGTSCTDGDPKQIVLEKLKSQGQPLSSVCYVNQGLRTGADKVTNKHIESYNLDNNRFTKGEGIFILNISELKKLELNNFEQSRILPIYKNKDIHKYVCESDTELRLIDLSWPGDRNLELKNVPNLIKHLSKYRIILENRKENANGLDKAIAKGIWWPMSVRRKLDFSKEKIVAPHRSKKNTFGYNSIPWYASADVYFITQKKTSISLKYVLALLNSKLYYSWLYYKGKRKGEMLELYQQPLLNIPIKIIPFADQRRFIELIDRILSVKNLDPKNCTKELEQQIDLLVYELYGLSEGEIHVIEND